MSQYRIEVAGAADLPAVMEIMRTAFDPQFGEAWSAAQCDAALTLPGASLFIARSADVAVGFALVRTIAGEAELMLIAVEPGSRGMGIGRALLKAVSESAKSSGAEALFLEVRSGNSARALYENVGFIQVGCRNRYYRGIDGEYFDAHTHRLDLK